MLRMQIYWMVLLILGGLVACSDDEKLGQVEKVNMLYFDFPQGNDPWDKEIEQIAKDWGMYIIYKDVDSTNLNRKWTTPFYNEAIYVCETPTPDELQQYLELVKVWLLGSLNKDKKSDLQSLPLYLYLVNDYRDNNSQSKTYGEHVQLNMNGSDYWSLSFTKDELEEGLTKEMIHEVACSFSYTGLKARFISGDYEIAPDFGVGTNYEDKIGTRYYSFEDWKRNNPYVPEFLWEVIYGYVGSYEKDSVNAYQRRGFAFEVSEGFKKVTSNYGAPTWMPWLPMVISNPNGDIEIEMNPDAGKLPGLEDRPLMDFLNIVRLAMTYSEEKIREYFPTDVSSPILQRSNQMINDKYDLVVQYMKEIYDVDLQRFASILDEE